MSNTKIEWADESWNFMAGCSPVSEGCAECYSARLAATRLKNHPLYKGLTKWVNGRPQWTGEIRLDPKRLEQPLHWKKPRRIFPCSMSDLFHEDIDELYLDRVLVTMAKCPQHIFLLLTKRPKIMLKVLSSVALDCGTKNAGDNLWLGVTAENQKRADERIPILLEIPAAKRFVSIEPMLGPVDLSACVKIQPICKDRERCPKYTQLDWVIVGGETGPKARPMDPEWARSVRDQCKEAGVPFFMKRMSNKAPIPDDLQIREFPT